MMTTPGYAGMQDTNPSCTRLMVQLPSFSSQALPPYPQMPDVPQVIQQYVPSVAVLVGNTLRNAANQNEAFRYLANVVGTTSFQAPIWSQMVSFGVMLLWIKMQNSPGVSVESLLQAASSDAVILKASFIAASTPIIFNYLDRDTQGQVQGFAQQHEQLRASFPQLLGQAAQQAAMAANPQLMAQAVGGMVGATIAQQATAPTDNIYGAVVARTDPRDQRPYGTVDNYGVPIQLKSLTQAPTRKRGNPYDQHLVEQLSPAEPAPAPAPVTFQSTVTEMTPTSVVTKELAEAQFVDASLWKPQPHQLYEPAYAGDEWKLQYEVVDHASNGKVVLAVINHKTEAEMNEAEHQIPTLNRAMRLALANATGQRAGEVVSGDLELLVKGTQSERVNETPEQTARLAALGLGADSDIADLAEQRDIENLIVAARTYRLQQGANGSVFLVTGGLVHDVVSESTAASEVLGWLSGSKDLFEVVNALNAGVDTYRDDAAMLATIAQVGKYLTDEVNFVLARLMNVPLKISDVLTDLDELFQVLKNDHGPAYHLALTRHQSVIVQKLFRDEMGISPIHAEVEAVEGEDAAEGPVAGYHLSFGKKVGVVLLGMDSSEFGIEIIGDRAYEVFDSNFPGLQSFISSVVNAWPDLSRIVVATLDGKLFGVGRSIMGDKPAIVFNA